MAEILWPVYGAESPWMVLDETIFEVNPGTGDTLTETILDIITP